MGAPQERGTLLRIGGESRGIVLGIGSASRDESARKLEGHGSGRDGLGGLGHETTPAAACREGGGGSGRLGQAHRAAVVVG